MNVGKEKLVKGKVSGDRVAFIQSGVCALKPMPAAHYTHT